MSKPIWDSIKLYFSGDEYFRDICTEIDKAQSEVLLESYIFDLDPIGYRILERLENAAKRGVQCRVLLDGVGSFNWTASLQKKCQESRIQLRIYNPIPFHQSLVKRFSWKSFRRVLMLLKKINKRNHRKVVLIDQHIAFAGGMNVSQVHTKEFMGQKAWRDTGVRVQGPALKLLRISFFQAWRSSRFIFIPKSFSIFRQILRLNNSARLRYTHLRGLNAKLRTAKKRILITNPYFVPRTSVLNSLRKAAQRGVYVGLCLPAKSDVLVVHWAARSLYWRLLKSGVHIYAYQNRVLHAKTLIVDDWATVGSHNLNHRSLMHDLEVEVVLDDAHSVQTLIKQWDEDLKNCVVVTKKDLGNDNLLFQALQRVAYWFRYWL